MPLTVTVNQFSGGVSQFTNNGAYGVGDYLYWMCGRFALEAQEILQIANPGGEVNTGGFMTVPFLPILVTASDFEPDGVTYNNPQLVGQNIMIYVNNYSASWYDLTSGAFVFTTTGIKITLPGFNIFAGTPPFSVVIQQNFNT